jgi:hypothetical protein
MNKFYLLTENEVEFLATLFAPPIHYDFLKDDDFYDFSVEIIKKFCEKNNLEGKFYASNV